MKKHVIIYLVLLVGFVTSCENSLETSINDLTIKEGVCDAKVGITKKELIRAAKSLYDDVTDSFESGSFSIIIEAPELNSINNLVCRYSAKYTTNDSANYPYVQVYYNNPPLNNESNRWRYKIGDEGKFRYNECKCITNGKTKGFSQSAWDGNYIIRLTIPKGVTLYIDSFLAEYDNNCYEKSAFKIMQHGSIFNSEMDCETNWMGWKHVNNYGAIVVPKRTIDGIWVCFHDDEFGSNPVVRVMGAPMDDLPARSIQECTYMETQTLEYKDVNSFDKHDRIPTLELFLQYCEKTGVHPVFSMHPTNWTNDQYSELRELVEKYGLLNKLNIKGGYNNDYYGFISKVYNTFGSDIESFLLDFNMTQPTQSQIEALASYNWDLSKITIGFEYMSFDGSYFSDDILYLMQEKGLAHGVAIIGKNFNSEFLKGLIAKGCSELTADYFYSNGLNW